VLLLPVETQVNTRLVDDLELRDFFKVVAEPIFQSNCKISPFGSSSQHTRSLFYCRYRTCRTSP
jgi:hypothetical protein